MNVQILADAGGFGSRNADQRSEKHDAVAVHYLRHTGQRINAATAQQPDQHRFRLVIQCMSQQHHSGIQLACRIAQFPIPCLTGGSLDAFALHMHAGCTNSNRGKATIAASFSGQSRHPIGA